MGLNNRNTTDNNRDDKYDSIKLIVNHLLSEGFIYDSPWLTSHQAARYTKLSQSYLSRLRHEGNGPLYSKVGKSVLYRTSDLDMWLESKLK